MTDNLFKISTINSGCLYMGDVKRDFATHGYLSYLLRNSPVFMEKMIAGTFFDLFLSRDPSIKRDNFYHVNTPSHFAWTILFWLCKLSQVKSSRVRKRPVPPTWADGLSWALSAACLCGQILHRVNVESRRRHGGL